MKQIVITTRNKTEFNEIINTLIDGLDSGQFKSFPEIQINSVKKTNLKKEDERIRKEYGILK